MTEMNGGFDRARRSGTSYLQTFTEELGHGVSEVTVSCRETLHSRVVPQRTEQSSPLLLADILEVVEVDILQFGIIGRGLLDNLVNVGVVRSLGRVDLLNTLQ